MILGVMIGSGIFASPGEVLLQAGSPGAALVVWVLAGTIALMGAICYVELGTSIPESGGDYAYIRRAWGAPTAFAFVWTQIMCAGMRPHPAGGGR